MDKNNATAADDARDAAERDLLCQALVSLESATSFLSKKARDGQPRLVAAIRKFLSTPAPKPAPNQWQRYYDALNELERVSEESTTPAAKPAED